MALTINCRTGSEIVSRTCLSMTTPRSPVIVNSMFLASFFDRYLTS